MTEAVVSSAVSSDNLEIPLIDFKAFLQGDEATRKATAQAILRGFENAGFIYLKNYAIPQEAVNKTFKQSAEFFDRPRSQKDALAWTTPAANRGYSKPGLEKTSTSLDRDEIAKERQEKGEDLKESFEIGRDDDPVYANNWPDRFDEDGREFKEHMVQFFDMCELMHREVMRAIALGIGVEEKFFDDYIKRGTCVLRLLHYPEVKSEVFKRNVNQVRAGAHADYGTVTLLFQDSNGGLQVMSPNGNFVDATPIADTVIVNAGDMLARWSNDTIKSTQHRVVEPPRPAEVHPSRYSIAYFGNPRFDAFIETIPGTYDESHANKYDGINAGEYLLSRLAATYD